MDSAAPPIDRDIQRHEIVWRGIVIEVLYEHNWLNSAVFPRAHLQLFSLRPTRAPLPMTETGYRSHFLIADDIDAAGGPVAYALAWLEHEAAVAKWTATAQLELF